MCTWGCIGMHMFVVIYVKRLKLILGVSQDEASIANTCLVLNLEVNTSTINQTSLSFTTIFHQYSSNIMSQ